MRRFLLFLVLFGAGLSLVLLLERSEEEPEIPIDLPAEVPPDAGTETGPPNGEEPLEVPIRQGDDERALPPHLEALEMRRRLAGGEPSPSVAWSLGHIGHLHRRSGDHDQARRLFEEGLAISRRVYGEAHPEVAFLHRSLGMLHDETGRTDLAAGEYRRAAEIYRGVDATHPDLPTILVPLAKCEVQLGDPDAAEADAAEARRLSETTGHYADGVRPALEELAGEIAFARGDLEGARAAYRRAVELRLAEHGEDDPRTARARERLAGL